MEKDRDFDDREDQRRFQFATASRDGDMALQRDRLRLVRNMVWALLASASVTVFSSLGFFGTETQRADAVALLSEPAPQNASKGFWWRFLPRNIEK